MNQKLHSTEFDHSVINILKDVQNNNANYNRNWLRDLL